LFVSHTWVKLVADGSVHLTTQARLITDMLHGSDGEMARAFAKIAVTLSELAAICLGRGLRDSKRRRRGGKRWQIASA